MALQAAKLAPFSREQSNFLFGSTAPINICHGPVRSGKNFIENVRMLHYLMTEPYGDPRSTVAFCGASINAVYDIFLSDLFDMIGEGNYTYNESNGRGTIYGRPFRCFPCQKSGDYKRLRGRTYGGALITEGTLCDPEFFNEMLARLSSIEGAKLFVDTNPAGPFHWLYTGFIVNEKLLAEGRVKAFPFNFDSNLSMPEENKENLKAYYGPGTLWYRRMILGEWCMADGVIYSGFNPDRHIIAPDRIPRKFDQMLSAGLDYGTSNPFAAIAGGKKDGIWYITREFYYDGRDKGQRSDHEHADALVDWMCDPLRNLYIDPSAASMKAELRKHAGFKATGCRIKDADNSVLEGIQFINSLLTNNNYRISSECVQNIREKGSYIWCPNAQKRGEDKPVKQNDHTQDGERYLIYSQEGKKSGFAKV